MSILDDKNFIRGEGIAVKRAACILLVLALLLTGASFCCAAQTQTDFSDRSSIRNSGAVQMLVDLGLISGYTDGSFRPGAYITREEVAKLIAILCTENPVAEVVTVFADCQDSWAKDYISYCAWRGIVVGDGVNFRPKDNVTAQELAKMLLVVLGEDAERYKGASWADNVNTDAQTRGIYDNLNAEVSAAVTRDNACLLVFNAMRCFAVADPHSDDPMQRYVLDDLMNPRTYLEVRYQLIRYNGTLTGNECADLTGNGKLEPGQTRLAGHKPFAVSTDLSMVGRSVDIYMKDGMTVGAPCCAAAEIYYTFSSADELAQICSGGAFALTEQTEYYLNYERVSAEVLDDLPPQAQITVIDHTGDLQFDIVLVTTLEAASVSSVSPLRVRVGEQEQEVRSFSANDRFSVGQSVCLVQVRDVSYIRPLQK